MPICTWRTMFSRTTMASSINNPTQSDKAISVIMLMVNPSAYMTRKVPTSAMGRVSPVMTVDRHELRNRNTISTVSTAPSSKVLRTFCTATRIWREPSKMGSSRSPAGNWLCMSAIAFCRPSTTAIVFSSCDFCTCSSKVRWPLYKARLSISCAPSTTRATWSRCTGTPPLA